MDDDNEDYLALFFTECGELLADLQEQLDRLMDGERDPELVNAAFRAVHSVKGGAAAFGFDHLIGFAHVFETVMDGLRSGRLQLGSDIVNLLMRSGDVMETLIEQARDGGDVDSGHVDRVRQELEEQIGRSSAEATMTVSPYGSAPWAGS